MLIADLLTISLRQIYRNKRRYKGATIGTALGIAGLITVVSMGESVESMLGKNLEILGHATIVKCEWDFGTAPRWHHGEYRLKDLEDIRRLPGVLQATPTVWKNNVKISCGNKKVQAGVRGIESTFFDTLYFPVETGRTITAEDVADRRQVCIIGQTVQKELFGPDGNGLGEKIEVLGLMFEVVGIIGGAEDAAHMEVVFIPLTVAQSKIHGMDKVRDIYVRAQDWDTVPILYQRVKELLEANQPGYAEAMYISYASDRISAIKTVVFIFKFFLYAAIVVTLVLGGLGITNVMLAVVNERTKEIGLRKAVGATEKMIMLQFLCESLAVSLMGAAVGILCGFWSVEILQKLFDTSTEYAVFILSVLVSVLVGMLLGVFSGLLPAARAGRLSAVEAMKFE